MSEKRFTRVEFSNGNWGVKDNNTEYEYPSPIDLLNLLNEQQERIEMLEKGILDCLFNNKSIGILAEKMELVE